MSERPTYTLSLASDRDTAKTFDRVMSYVYWLLGPDGAALRHRETGADNMIFKRMGDPDYLALLDALPHVPEDVDLHVLTVRQHLYERVQYLGILNERPEDRVNASYRKGAKRKGRYANEEQLRELDKLLISRRIITSGDRPTPGPEEELHRRSTLRATELLSLDPSASEPGDY